MFVGTNAFMAINAAVSFGELRASLAGLAYCCPIDHCNPADCPLFLLRKLPPADRLLWFDSLDNGDVQFLAAYHCVCMNLKRTKRPAILRARFRRQPA